MCVCVLQNSIPSCAQCAIGKDLQQALLKILYNVMSVIVKKKGLSGNVIYEQAKAHTDEMLQQVKVEKQ